MQRSERAHYTLAPAAWVAGASDVGQRHQSNEDALCIAVREGDDRAAVIAVADGVSTAHGSEVASLVAAERAVTVLVERHRAGTPDNVAVVEAFAQAHEAVLASPVGGEPSACTLITAQVAAGQLLIANVGDSRAYWFGDDGEAVLLSTDDSLAQARIMLGMSRDDAELSAHAHAITKWLGRNATNVLPSVICHRPTGAGWLLLCTDGLWNYASAPAAMGDLLRTCLARSASLSTVVEELVAWANQQGGRDNITAVLARVDV